MPYHESSTLALPETVIIVRHGHYPTNAKTFGGWQLGDPLPELPTPEEDARLSIDDLGKEQVARVGEFISELYPDVEVVFSSKWQRAIDTANGLSDAYTARRKAGLQIVKKSELQERDRGPVYRAKPRPWLELQPDYQIFLDSPSTWVPNHFGKPEEQGETLIHKAAVLRSLWPEMGKLAAGKTLALSTHGEVTGGAALIAFAGFGDEELKKPLPGGDRVWMPRTVNNCGGYIFTAPQEDTMYSRLMRFDASQEQIHTTDWIPINR